MKVKIVTKPGCPRCLLLKQKLDLLGVEWEEEKAFGRGTGDLEFPLTIIDGEPYEYADAIKKLKEMLDEDIT